MAFQHVPVGPWPLGMARPERATDFPPQALADAVNVDVRPEGSVVTAGWWELALASNAHSLFQTGDVVYGVVNNQIGRFEATGFTPLSVVERAVAWADTPIGPCYTDGYAVYRVTDTGVEQLQAAADAEDGERVIEDLPGGEFLTYWNGRLLVADGQHLMFSQPLRYGAHDPLSDYIAVPAQVRWLAALETGFYVGFDREVVWFDGAAPKDLRMRRVAGASAPGAVCVVDGGVLGKPAGMRVAVFFTAEGFVIGDGQGIVAYPQADRFSTLPLYAGRIFCHGHRLFYVRQP